MPEQPRIGFIGVDLVGHGMARNILAAGYSLTIKGNRDRIPVDDLVRLQRGALNGAPPATAPARQAGQ